MSRRDSLDSDTSEEPSDRGGASDALAIAVHVAVPQVWPFPRQSWCPVGQLSPHEASTAPRRPSTSDRLPPLDPRKHCCWRLWNALAGFGFLLWNAFGIIL